MINPETLYFPKELAPHVGLAREQVANLKRLGCRFWGRKTKFRWVTEFLEKQEAQAPEEAMPAHLPHSSSNKSGEPS